MTNGINRDRRRFLGTAAMAVTAASHLGMMRSSGAQSGVTTMRQPVLLSVQARRGFRSLRWLASVSRVATTPRSFET
jgi:hypothetical protein